MLAIYIPAAPGCAEERAKSKPVSLGSLRAGWKSGVVGGLVTSARISLMEEVTCLAFTIFGTSSATFSGEDMIFMVFIERLLALQFTSLCLFLNACLCACTNLKLTSSSSFFFLAPFYLQELGLGPLYWALSRQR